MQPFPGPGPKTRVSVGGGTFPRWRRDGRELFYLAPDSGLMAVPVEPGDAALAIGSPQHLFTLPTHGRFEPSADGREFLLAAIVADAAPLTVIQHWQPPLR